MKKALKQHGWPEAITTDDRISCGATMNELGNCETQVVGFLANKGAEIIHLYVR